MSDYNITVTCGTGHITFLARAAIDTAYSLDRAVDMVFNDTRVPVSIHDNVDEVCKRWAKARGEIT